MSALQGPPSPGFRVMVDELSDERALALMAKATDAVKDAALAARYALLSEGFAIEHSLCNELDETAAQYALARSVVALSIARRVGRGSEPHE